MASTGDIVLQAVVNDGTRDTQIFSATPTISDVVLTNGKREDVSLPSGFTALSPPTGATAVLIRFVSGAVTATLKGVTGDTGIVLQAGTLTTIPICLPLSSASIGITTNGTAVAEILWL